MKKVALYIDTTNNKKTSIILIIDGEKFEEVYSHDNPREDMTLETIEKVLHNHDIMLNDINEIFVNRGPGSFTGIRVGVSIANTLAFALGVPVNNLPLGQKEEPLYE